LAAGTLAPFDAVIFDLDGVVTDTASVHLAAWKELLDGVLQDRRLAQEVRRGPFTAEDYRRFVDGRTREDGLRTFLASRGAMVPSGSPGDDGEVWSLAGLAARKDSLFTARIRRQGVKSYPGTTALLARLRAGGVHLGLVTASRNASLVLAAAGLGKCFDTVVDGVSAAALGLPGKPEPAVFLEAARRLGVDPGQSVIVEDAVAGVEAGRRGGFRLVVGIDRSGQREELEAAGADVVLEDLSEFDIGLVLTDPLLLVYEGFDPAQEGHREALTTLGNGYWACRGAAPERSADSLHYPGTYLAGVYNRLSSVIQGQVSEDEHMVNAPNWTVLDVCIAGGKWWSQGGLTFRQERRELDLRRAVLRRTVLLEGDGGRLLEVVQRRLVSMAVPHLAALETVLVPQGWSGRVQVRSGIDAHVTNGNVPEYAGLANGHLVFLAATDTEDGCQSLEVGTSQSHIRIATALCTRTSGPPLHAEWAQWQGQPAWLLEVALQDGIPLTVTKTAAAVTSRDRAVSSPRSGALAVLADAGAQFEDILNRHEAAWQRLWDLFEVFLEADPQSQLILNLHVFHLLQTITGHTQELDAGVPARGLHGEGYRGHIFWDELFVLPLVTSRLPDVARSLLDYRWRRLDAARRAARSAGLAGALFPWQSGSDGREETPQRLFNPRSGRWVPDHSHLQRHVGLAVAFNAWQYFAATGDRSWLLQHGAELIVEVARLFASMAEHDRVEDRYHLRAVMGPDEYHDGYPGRPGQGLDDNAYTNMMAAWVCRRAAGLLTLLAGRDGTELQERLRIGQDEAAHWEHLASRMFVPFHDGVISQFDGYADLLELDWERYRRTYGNIERLDLILEAEGDSTNRYRLAKQADVLMLLYLFGETELIELLGRSGYQVDHAQLAATVDYYLGRTAHGSTLSRVVHASVLAARDPDLAWHTFREALDADLDDTQGGTTRTGIHLGAMAGTVDVVQRTFAGLRSTAEGLVFTPRLPSGLRSVAFRVRHRGQLLDIALDHQRLRLSAAAGDAGPVHVRVGGESIFMLGGEVHEFELPNSA